MLFNGDRLTGEVKELVLGQLQFKTDNLGTTYIEWDKIVSVSATGEFELQLVNGDLLLGSIDAGPSEGEMTLDQETGKRVLDLSSILRITRIKRSFWDRIDGKLDLGASYSQASEVEWHPVAASQLMGLSLRGAMRGLLSALDQSNVGRSSVPLDLDQ